MKHIKSSKRYSKKKLAKNAKYSGPTYDLKLPQKKADNAMN